MSVTVEKDDFSIPTGVNSSNIYVYENGKRVKLVGDVYTKDRD